MQTTTDRNEHGGVIDLIARIMRVMLKKPAFKHNVRLLLNNIDDDSAPELARTMLWEDMEFTFNLVGALPSIINAVIKFSNELLSQLTEKIPDDLLRGFFENAAKEIDITALDSLKERSIDLWNRLSPVIAGALSQQPAQHQPSGPADAENIPGKDTATAGPASVAGEPAPVDGLPKIDKAAGASVLGEIIATPFIKEMIREITSAIDRDPVSPGTAKIIWQDMEFTFGLIAVLPPIINSLNAALGELVNQIDEKIDPALLKDFLSRVISDVDAGIIAKNARTCGHIASKLLEFKDVRESCIRLTEEQIAPWIGKCLNSLFVNFNRVRRQRPRVVKNVIDHTISQIDSREFKDAAMGILNPALDRISLTRLAWSFCSGRIKYLFSRK
ncbi:MAG: hypothetical protein JXA07_11995 [Spirochaetes bacterium]|nr:hypothetical protein [Spirochaetota bacterium]